MNVDPTDHYCREIVELHEGGSTIDDPVAGLTSDMKGRWTIGAFNHEDSNTKETPKLVEDFGYAEHRYSQPEIDTLNHMGFRWSSSDKEWLNDSGEREYGVHKDSYDNHLVLRVVEYDSNGDYSESYEHFKTIQELEEYLK